MRAFRGNGAGAPLRVGMFTYSTAPRGSVVHAAALAEALFRRGCAVTLYALDKARGGFYRDVACGLELVPAEPAPSAGEALVRQRILELSAYVQARGLVHDVFHAQDCLTANALLACQAQTSSCVVRTVHHVERFDCPYLAVCQDRSILTASVLCAVSHTSAREVRHRYGREPRVVGNGVHADRLRSVSGADVVGVRDELLAGCRGPLVLSVGGIEPRKNSLRMLQAFAQFKRVHPTAVWAIVGGATALDHGDYRRVFDAALGTYEWSRDVVRLGVVSEARMSALQGGADVLLNVSQQEGFGLTILEALACGLPVVASHGPPFDEYLSARSALLVDPDDPGAIAKAMIEATAFPTVRQQAGRHLAAAHGWDAVAARTIDVYERLLAAKGSTSEVGVTYA